MKKLLLASVLLGLLAGNVEAQSQRTSGYVRSNGTYVAPSYRTKSDGYKYNNYSTKGNINPYTGKNGTKSTYGR
jgi:hypothetical protein